MPSVAAQARRQPLPEDVLEVIRIAAGCDEALQEAVRFSGREGTYVKAAAEFYLQQILLFSTADSYRVLGVRADAERDEIRRHLRWLMIWLHPDRAKESWQTAFAARVLEAWRDVGRAAPGPAARENTRRTALPPESPRSTSGRRPLLLRRHGERRPAPGRREGALLGLLLVLLMSLLIVIFVFLDPDRSFGAER